MEKQNKERKLLKIVLGIIILIIVLIIALTEGIGNYKVEVETQDGITLRGTQYMQNEENNKER